jgi:hypothetical protein
VLHGTRAALGFPGGVLCSWIARAISPGGGGGQASLVKRDWNERGASVLATNASPESACGGSIPVHGLRRKKEQPS